jgi:invasion protein IalB
MPTRAAFIALLVVAFVVLSVLADRSASTQRVTTGTVAEMHGDWMLVTNTGSRVPVAFREKTVYEGDSAAIKPGVRVTVWYRGMGERRPVASKVRVLDERKP